MAESPLYHRIESDSQSAEDAKNQIDTQEIWGTLPRHSNSSHIPKVKAYTDALPLAINGKEKQKGIEFTTNVEPDKGGRPNKPTWSGEREGVRNEEGEDGEMYAKIKVQVKFCNQLDEVWVADE